METLSEGKLACTFPDDWHVTKYDDWNFYKNHFKESCGGSKAVDFLGITPDKTLWLIELKDYRQFRRTKDAKIPLWDEMATKVRDTLAGLFVAKQRATDTEQVFARKALRTKTIRVALHLEQPRNPSKLFRRDYDRAAILQKLKQTLKPIDPHPRVVELADMQNLPWTATSIP